MRLEEADFQYAKKHPVQTEEADCRFDLPERGAVKLHNMLNISGKQGLRRKLVRYQDVCILADQRSSDGLHLALPASH